MSQVGLRAGLGQIEWQLGNRDWRQEAMVSGDRLGRGER